MGPAPLTLGWVEVTFHYFDDAGEDREIHAQLDETWLQWGAPRPVLGRNLALVERIHRTVAEEFVSIGAVIRKPEPRAALDGGQAHVVWSLRVSEDVFYVVAFGKLGDIVAHYVHAGAKLYVEGRLRLRGEVLADNIIMLGHRGRLETPPQPKEKR